MYQNSANLDVRVYAQQKGVRLWRIAQALGIVDSTLCKKMRFELPDEEKERFREIIDTLAQQRQEEA